MSMSWAGIFTAIGLWLAWLVYQILAYAAHVAVTMQ